MRLILLFVALVTTNETLRYLCNGGAVVITCAMHIAYRDDEERGFHITLRRDRD